MTINPNRFNKPLSVGEEVNMTRQGRLVAESVVVMDFREVVTPMAGTTVYSGSTSHRREVYVEHENGDCEWVPRSWLKREES